MAKLVDVPDLGSGAARRVGSSPITRTKNATHLSLESCIFFIFMEHLIFLLDHFLSRFRLYLAPKSSQGCRLYRGYKTQIVFQVRFFYSINLKIVFCTC